jgi:thioredoxin reductase
MQDTTTAVLDTDGVANRNREDPPGVDGEVGPCGHRTVSGGRTVLRKEGKIMSRVPENGAAAHPEGEARVRYDAVIVGAGTAGLSAALVLGRSRRRVLVLGDGEPRNAPATGVHGFFTRDGMSPGELLEIGHRQLAPYPSVEYRTEKATEARGGDGAFEVALEGGETVSARKLVLATGVSDDLPERPGFGELWGRGVYHCPYCHGWEVRDRSLAVYAGDWDPAGPVGRAVLIRNWSRDLVLLTDGPSGLDATEREKLAALGVPLNEKRIARLEGRSDGSEGLSKVVFEDGSTLAREGLFYAPPQRQRSGLAESLGCEVEAMGPAAELIKANPMTRETSVAGVFVVGDAGPPPQSVANAVASGANAAAFLNRSLCVRDAEAEIASAVGAGVS